MIIERDVAIPADDGLVLRADIYRPETTEPVPVIMVLGPYGKGVDFKEGYTAQWQWLNEKHPNWADFFPTPSTHSYMTWETVDPELWTAWGYACIRVDSRGSGRTAGVIDIYSPREIKDFYDAIEWAGVQSWCNGKVGLNGISYYAITQWLVAALQPPHLTAMIPWEGAGDCYRDFLRHGGILSNAFVQSWYQTQVYSNQHGNPDGHFDHWMKEKATGPSVLSEEERRTLRMLPWEDSLQRPLDGPWYRERSADWSKIAVPFLSASNWGGIGLHARGNYEAFTQTTNAKQKWLEVHPGRHDESFYLKDAVKLQRRFLDHFLKGEDNGWDSEPPVILQMRRPEQPYSGIRKETEWPLQRTAWTKMYLSASDQQICATTVAQKEEVTFDAAEDELLFETKPLSEETEFTGPMAVKLFVSSSTTDADLFLTLQAFSPEGKEVEFQGAWDPHTPLSHGWLRASHRKLDATLSKPYRPYHTHDESQPLAPGAIYELDIELWPTNIVLPAGYRLALRVSGRDFQRPLDHPFSTSRARGVGPFLHNDAADRGSETFAGKTTVYTGTGYDSCIVLPVIPS